MSTGKPRDPSKERFWRRTIRHWQNSGLSITAFCHERGLSLPSFHAWRGTLRRRDDRAGSFVPVRVVDGRVEVRAADLQMLLDGVDLDSVQRSRRYRRPTGKAQ